MEIKWKIKKKIIKKCCVHCRRACWKSLLVRAHAPYKVKAQSVPHAESKKIRPRALKSQLIHTSAICRLPRTEVSLMAVRPKLSHKPTHRWIDTNFKLKLKNLRIHQKRLRMKCGVPLLHNEERPGKIRKSFWWPMHVVLYWGLFVVLLWR